MKNLFMFFFVAIMSDVYMIINFTSNLPSCLKVVKDVLSRKWNKEKNSKFPLGIELQIFASKCSAKY